ncbi:glycyl-radical enzyme activating protein [Enterococcus sp. AZ103]|uniref:glycyl-radical enzyme activating protein n=1 Tax=Enterococcus sp. AZ103 TaxID=2774628 RepID=UPI003F1F9BEB
MEPACIFNIQKFSIHDGPGIRTVVFFKGCPLSCYWCANPESQNGRPEKMWDQSKKAFTTVGEYKSIEEIIVEVMKDEVFYEESGGGVTLSGGEVLYQAKFATELLRQLKEKNIHTASETTGFARFEVFQKFIAQVDLLYFDVKHHDEAAHKAGVGVSLQPILKNLAEAVAHHPHLIVRIPVIPQYNDGEDNAQKFAELFQDMQIKQVELLPFHQFGEKKYQYLDRSYQMHDVPQIQPEELVYFQEIMEAHGINCHI